MRTGISAPQHNGGQLSRFLFYSLRGKSAAGAPSKLIDFFLLEYQSILRRNQDFSIKRLKEQAICGMASRLPLGSSFSGLQCTHQNQKCSLVSTKALPATSKDITDPELHVSCAVTAQELHTALCYHLS